MDPEHSIIAMHFLEKGIWKYEGSDEVKYACLKISLKDNIESNTADSLVDYLQVLQWAAQFKIIGVTKNYDENRVHFNGVENLQLVVFFIIPVFLEKSF